MIFCCFSFVFFFLCIKFNISFNRTVFENVVRVVPISIECVWFSFIYFLSQNFLLNRLSLVVSGCPIGLIARHAAGIFFIELKQSRCIERTLGPKFWTSCCSSKWIHRISNQLAKVRSKMPFGWCRILPYKRQCCRPVGN